MPMLVSCRKTTNAHVHTGFSLLELLVVLALISLMTALVAPRLKNTVDAISRSGDRAEAARQLQRLPLLARRDGSVLQWQRNQPITLAGMQLPEGWAVQALDPVRIEASGYCHAALLAVAMPGHQERWQLAAPDCRVSDAQ